MRKIKGILISLVIIMLMAAPAWGKGTIGNTADALCATGTGYLRGILVHTDGTNAVTLAVYDNTAASGTKLFSTWTVTTSATNRTSAIEFTEQECPFYTGIYVDVTTSGTVTFDCFYDAR